MRINRVLATGLAIFTLIASGTGSAQAAGTLDQQFGGATFGSGATVDTLTTVAQAVTPSMTGLLDSVDVYLARDNAVTADISVSIYAASSGIPSGPALATSVKAFTDVNPAGSWLTFGFANSPRISAGTQFAIVLSSTQAATDHYRWGVVGLADQYAGGKASWSYSGSAFTFQSFTASFRTYVSQSSDGSVPAPVMQQFGMPSSGTCDAAAPIVLNWGGASSGSWGKSWAEWANGGKGGPVCTRTLSYSNAVGHWVAS